MRQTATLPALVLSAALGVWLLAAPEMLGLSDLARLSHVVVGPIVASVAVIAMWPVARLVARVNVVLGLWLVLAPILFDHSGWWAESVAVGLAIVLLSLVPQSQAHRFGGGWGSLLDPASDADRDGGEDL